MPSWVLFPRLHLAEIEDQSWCPSWLREHTHKALARKWAISNSSRGSPATQVCQLLLQALGGPKNAAHFTFVDVGTGAGGPISLLEPAVNAAITADGYSPVEFVLTDLWPDLAAWEPMVKRSDHISFIREPVDATKAKRFTKPGIKECRLFHGCFHHFDDPIARGVLASNLQNTDAFMIVETCHRTLPSLLNATIIILSCYITTIFDFYWSPLHLICTYIIPIVPIFYATDAYVSCARGRTPREISALLPKSGVNLDEWEFKSGEHLALLPFGKMYWYSGVKKTY